MRIFKSPFFARFADKKGISDEELKAAVVEIESGIIEADLGGNVYKKRIARAGAGKRRGYRVVVFFKSGERTFFHYGFAKSAFANINEKQLKWYKEVAKAYLEMTAEQITTALKAGVFIEI